MPQIPVQSEQTVFGSERGLQPISINSPPGAFGYDVGTGLKEVGAAISGASDMLARHAVAFQGLKNETVAKDADRVLNNGLIDLQFNPKTGFQTKLGRDAVDSYDDAFKAANDLFKATRESLPNDEARRMFDSVAIRSLRYSTESMAQHTATQNKQWMIKTGEARIANMQQIGATYYNDDAKFDQVLGAIKAETVDLGALMGSSPDTVQQMTTQHVSQAWTARLNSLNAQDPDAAWSLFTEHKSEMDASHQASMLSTISQHMYVKRMREEMEAQRAEREGEHRLKMTQTAVTADIMGSVLRGEQLNMGALADFVKNQVISETQLSAIMSMRDKINEGINNPVLEVQLLKGTYDHTTSYDMVMDAVARKQLTGTKGMELIIHMMAKDKEGHNSISTGYHKALMDAIIPERAFIDMNGEFGRDKANLMSMAQSEWTKRVDVNKEDPQAVFQDMIPRFQNLEGIGKYGLPRPRAGAINSIESAVDVARKNEEMRKKGIISDDEYRNQVKLIGQWGRIMQEQQERAMKVPKVTPGVKSPSSSTGGKDKVLGTTPNQ